MFPTGYTHRILHVSYRIYTQDIIFNPQDIPTGYMLTTHRVCSTVYLNILWVISCRLHIQSCRYILYISECRLQDIHLGVVYRIYTHRIFIWVLSTGYTPTGYSFGCCLQDIHPQDIHLGVVYRIYTHRIFIWVLSTGYIGLHPQDKKCDVQD